MGGNPILVDIEAGTVAGRGTKVFDAPPARGRWKAMESADDVLDLMDASAEGVVALVRDAGATFLAPIYHELSAVVCTSGTPRSHIGIISREFQVPCIMGCVLEGIEPSDGDEVEVDCSGASGVLRVIARRAAPAIGLTADPEPTEATGTTETTGTTEASGATGTTGTTGTTGATEAAEGDLKATTVEGDLKATTVEVTEADAVESGERPIDPPVEPSDVAAATAAAPSTPSTEVPAAIVEVPGSVPVGAQGEGTVKIATAALDDGAKRTRVNAQVAYIAPIALGLTEERTSLESKIIPVSAYIVTACIESFLRYPEMMRAIDEVMPAERIGRLARRPGCRVNTVNLWSVVNFFLIGRKVWQMVDPAEADNLDKAYDVMDFWERATGAFRGDGTRHAADSGVVTPYSSTVIETLLAGVTTVADPELHQRIRTLNATLVAYLFLLYFDTRVGHGDTGPYHLADGRVLLVRDFYEMAESDFWWSGVAAEVPYRNLTAAMVLDGVTVDRVTDFGTSYTTPEDFLDRLVGFGLYTTDGMPPGQLRQVPLGEMGGIVTAVRAAQAAHYRNISAMTRDDKIRCGAYVYFSFLRPFAAEAGIADSFDWTVPRDIPPPLYEMVSLMEGDNSGPVDDGPYYAPF